LQLEIDRANERIADITERGQQATVHVREMRETLTTRKSQVKLMYEKVKEGLAKVRAMETRKEGSVMDNGSGEMDELSQLLSVAKQRAATTGVAEERVPWPPISPKQVASLSQVLAMGMDVTMGQSCFGKLWLLCTRQAYTAFHSLSTRLVSFDSKMSSIPSSTTTTATTTTTTTSDSTPTPPPLINILPNDSEQSIASSYVSPLLALRSYRVSSMFGALEKDTNVGHASYSNQITPNTSLCRFELGGTCNDPECTYLHRRDYELSGADALVEDLGRYSTPAQLEEARAIVRGLDTVNNPSPEVVQRIWQVLSTPTLPLPSGPSRPATVAQRSYSESAAKKAFDQHQQDHGVPKPPRLRKAKNNEPGYIAFDEQDDSSGKKDNAADTVAVVGDGPQLNRFHESGVAVPANDALIHMLVLQEPHNVALWLKMVRSHLLPGGSLLDAAGILAKALELNEHSAALWIVYLLIFMRMSSSGGATGGDANRIDVVFESAIRRVPSSLTLWQMWINTKTVFEDKDVLCKRAVMAIAKEQCKSYPNVNSQLSCALFQMLLMHTRVLADSGRRDVIEEVLREWTEGRTELIGPHQFLPRDHVNLMLVLIGLHFDTTCNIPALTPLTFRERHYFILSFAAGVSVELLERLRLDEANAISRGYSFFDFVPLRINRVRACLAAGNVAMAAELFEELGALCPGDPDVQWLACSVGQREAFENRFVTAFSSMTSALIDGAPLRKVLSLPEPAASEWIQASLQRPHTPHTLVSDWKELLGVDAVGVEALLRPTGVVLTGPDLVCAWLCLLMRELLEGSVHVGAMFEDALHSVAHLGVAVSSVMWTCYLAYCSGQSVTLPFESLLARARTDLLLPANPPHLFGRIAPTLPDSVYEPLEDMDFLTPQMRYHYHNHLLYSLLQPLPPLARRRIVSEVLQSTPDNTALVLWCVHTDLQALLNSGAQVTTQEVLDMRPLVFSLVKRCPNDVYARLCLAQMVCWHF
jgi:hypothetical protein